MERISDEDIYFIKNAGAELKEAQDTYQAAIEKINEVMAATKREVERRRKRAYELIETQYDAAVEYFESKPDAWQRLPVGVRYQEWLDELHDTMTDFESEQYEDVYREPPELVEDNEWIKPGVTRLMEFEKHAAPVKTEKTPA